MGTSGSFSCCGLDFGDILKGLLARLVFALHAGACVLRIMDLGDGQQRTWPVYMYIGLAALMLLDAVCCHCVFKESWKIFSPTIALYIICTAVCVWWMQLTVYELRRDYAESGHESNVSTDPDTVKIPLSSIAEIQYLLPLEFTLPEWCDILVQLMMFILIVGRWLLPKGKLSRDQLSQLLLVQIAMAADILELLCDGFSANLAHIKAAVMVLSIWSWSLPQFTLSLTVTRGKRPKTGRRGSEGDPSGAAEDMDYHRYRELCCATDLWSIFLSLLMQDVPFLVLRLYIIFSGVAESLVTTQAFFFSCKNAFVILLQVYRAGVILSENQTRKRAWKRTASRAGVAGAPRSSATVELESATWEESTADTGVWYIRRAARNGALESGLRATRSDIGLQMDSVHMPTPTNQD